MSEQSSYVYYRFPEGLSDKMSYGFQHPENIEFVESIRAKAQAKGYSAGPLQNLLKDGALSKESIEPSEYPNKPFRYLGLEDVESDTGRIREYQEMFGLQIRSKSVLFYEGDILFARLRPYLNKVYLVKREKPMLPIPSRDKSGDEGEKHLQTIGSGEFYVINPDNQQVQSEFLYRYLLSDLTLTQTKWILSGNSYPRLDEDQFLGLLVIVPPMPEQARILRELAILEHQLDPINAEIDATKGGVNSLILKELGFPQTIDNDDYFFRNGRYADSQYFVLSAEEIEDRLSYNYYLPRLTLIDELKRRYSITTLAQIVGEDIRRGEQPHYSDNGEVIAIKTVDLRDAFIDYANCLHVSRESYDRVPKAHVRRNDILVSSTGYVSMGKVDICDCDAEAMVDGHISILRLKDGFDPFFVTYYLRSTFGKVQIEKWWTGSSGQIELQPLDLGNFVIPDNSANGITLPKQKEIAHRITEHLSNLTKLETRKLELLKHSRQEFLKQLGFVE